MLSNSAWKLTGPQERLVGRVTIDTQALPSSSPKASHATPTPSLPLHSESPQGMLLLEQGCVDTPAPTTYPCLGGNRGSWVFAGPLLGILPL